MAEEGASTDAPRTSVRTCDPRPGTSNSSNQVREDDSENHQVRPRVKQHSKQVDKSRPSGKVPSLAHAPDARELEVGTGSQMTRILGEPARHLRRNGKGSGSLEDWGKPEGFATDTTPERVCEDYVLEPVSDTGSSEITQTPELRTQRVSRVDKTSLESNSDPTTGSTSQSEPVRYKTLRRVEHSC